jgi:hypothetical protein
VNDYDLKRWRATSNLNQAQVLTMNFIYALPFFKSSSNPFAKQALGGWRVSGITSWVYEIKVGATGCVRSKTLRIDRRGCNNAGQ